MDVSGSLTPNPCSSHNELDNLTQVVQGSQTRAYGYDALPRPTSASTPDSDRYATTFGYDNNSNLTTRVAPKPNQTNPSVAVTTTYEYDALHRLSSKDYSDTTPSPDVTYTYDQSDCLGLGVPCYNLGGRTTMTDSSGSTK